MSAAIPEEVHRLRGTRPTRAAIREATCPSGRPKKPTHLSPLASDKWDELVRLFSKRRTLTKGDGFALEILCETYARWRACLADLAERGPMVEETFLSKGGEPITRRVQNPAAKLAAQMENSMRAMMREFSATPASREKAKPAQPETKKERFPVGSIGWIREQEQKEAKAQEQTQTPQEPTVPENQPDSSTQIPEDFDVNSYDV